MKPEDLARQEIDRQLEQCGWVVQDHKAMNIMAGLGVAVREFPLKTGAADYLLYVSGKVIGLVEAKPVGHTLTGVELQSSKYSEGLPEDIPNYVLPIPFMYESTGVETQFTNCLDPVPRSREEFTFHRPEELLRLVNLDHQLRYNLTEMPVLAERGLWQVQIEAIYSLEESLSHNRPRALIQMATGSGKTFTACTSCFRLIKFGMAKRILFLVDRNNLGRQTLREFQKFQSPYTSHSFTEEYHVQHLKKNIIDPAGKVCITTIQRLYSILKGEEEFEDANEEQSMFETESPLRHDPMPVVYNPQIPIETFDFIVVDECHRSIYNVWRQVLEYFDAFIIGLTATPTPQTVGFFFGNVVQNYSHEKAVADGVNVGYEVYSIRTKVTATGATLEKAPEMLVVHRDKRTREKRLKELEDDLTYSGTELDRDVVNPAQIRLIIQTFRDKLFTEIFPGRKEVPKTLVFAKNDNHAEDIVRIIRQEFGKGNDFCQKITYRTTGKKPEEVLNEFRNSYNPRIAVTVDMIATGTDVKPLECLLFMRMIRSASYFEQMKGRGSRIIGTDDLLAVTPDALHKTHYVIVDAVGVCEEDKTASKPLDRNPSVPLDKLLQMVAQGRVHPDIVSTLAARLARLGREISQDQSREIASQAEGESLSTLTSELLTSIDPDVNWQKAVEKYSIPEGQEPTEKQLDEVEHESMTEALKPFHQPKLRELIIVIKSSLEQVIDEITQDELLSAGYDADAKLKAKSKLEDFRRFLEENRDEIEAIRILYSKPYRAGLRYAQVKELRDAIERPPLSLKQPEFMLWKLYEAVEPDQVKGKGGKALVDLVAIVRHALHPEEPLVPVGTTVEERYVEWLSEQETAGVEFTREQRKWLDAIRDHIASSLYIDQDDFELPPLSQLGGLGKAHQLFGDKLSTILDELNERLAA